ncbi:MAG: CHAP domain-containing protein [Acidobacteria bacterium]|nr:CHAP domain-containing protein [Acidobacteriota bacterium]
MRRVLFSALLVTSFFTLSTSTTLLAPVRAATACGEVLIKGTSWLQGNGVDVRSNGANTFTGVSCNGVSVSTPLQQYGYGFQCVELAARLYRVRNWGTVFANGGAQAGAYQFGAKYLPEGSSGLKFYPVTSSYVPVPGDLIIESGTGYGHVSVVDHVESALFGIATVVATEQNASWTGWHVYERTSGAMTGGYHPVRGFLHSPRNSHTAVATPRRGFVAVTSGQGNGLLGALTSGVRNFNTTLSAKSSPDIAATSKGSFALAVVAKNRHLTYFDGQGRQADTGVVMSEMGSPSLALDNNDLPWIAAHEAGGRLTVWSLHRRVDTDISLRPGSSPQIALDSAGRYYVATVGVDSSVSVVSDAGTVSTGLVVRAGSNPSIAVLGNGVIKVAGVTSLGKVQMATSNSGDAYVLESPTTLSVRVGTSAVVHASGSSGYQVAYVTTAGVPQMFGSLGSLSGTWSSITAVSTPGLAVRSDGMVVLAVRDSSNRLWVVNKNAAVQQSIVTSPFSTPAIVLLR